MTPHPLTTSADSPIEEAARLMPDRKIGSLPVMRDDRLVGLITESDIFRAFVAIFDGSSGGVRATFDVSRTEDTLELVSKLACARHVRVHSLIATEQHGRPICVIRFAGAGADALVEDLWNSGHHVLNVLKLSSHPV